MRTLYSEVCVLVDLGLSGGFQLGLGGGLHDGLVDGSSWRRYLAISLFRLASIAAARDPQRTLKLLQAA